jgi:hypothetical protein
MTTSSAMEPPAAPPVPRTLEETGLRLDLLVQLLVKTLHLAGDLSALDLAERVGLTYPVIDPVIEQLKVQRLCEIIGGTAIGAPSYRYRITDLGRDRATLFLDRNMYTGLAPVPLDQYTRYMEAAWTSAPRHHTRENVRAAFANLVLSTRVIDQLGPAMNARHSLFVYGPPGNGKTVISQAVRNLMGGDFWIPYAIEVEGSLIRVFDQVNHQAISETASGLGLDASGTLDRRWIRCQRPSVTVGGELTLDHLELTYSKTSGFYRAPVQLLANGGVLVIDDFGRQACSPHALLNRWITPLESRVDYLTLQSGQKVGVPFHVLPVFATNIRPGDLVDEAFLRRIHYKVHAENPTPAEFTVIFERVCAEQGVPFDPAHVTFLLKHVYQPKSLPLRGCQPRDLISQALALAQYRGEPRALSAELLEAASMGYFVDEHDGVSRRP